jgi:hypothetical protein
MHKCTYRTNTITRIRKRTITPQGTEYILHGEGRMEGATSDDKNYPQHKEIEKTIGRERDPRG